MIGLLIFGVFLLLTILSVPVITAIAFSGLTGMIVLGFSGVLFLVPQQLLEGIGSTPLVAVPFFILAGNLLNLLGLTDKIFGFAGSIVGHIRGGLAQVNILASLLFSGISGAAVADCAALGTVEINAMRERGYKPEFAASITAASSIIGPIFPPSIPLLIYAYVATESVGRLFLAGILPALTITAILMIYVAFIARRNNFPVEARSSLKEIMRKGAAGFFALLAPFIILAGMLSGVMTATEAGVVTCFYTLGLGLKYRTLTIAKVSLALRQTIELSGVIVLMLGFSTVIAWDLAIAQVPQELAEFALLRIESPITFILIYILFFLLLGTVFDTLAAMVVLMPVVLPIVDAMGIDRVHFGIVTVFALMIGILTPPLGIALYIMMDIAKVRFEVMARSILPFLIPLILALLLIAFIPSISLYLPNLIMGDK